MEAAARLAYREYHARRDRERRQEMEGLRLHVLEQAKGAIRETAPGFPAIHAVYLFESQESLIVVAYRLHSLYTAFENIFRNIAASFENHLDQAGWHRQLPARLPHDVRP
jgi:hypothetical protein